MLTFRRGSALLVAAIVAVQPAFTWGPIGHSVVGLIAQERLSPQARARVRKLLENHSLSDIASCPDELRPNKPGQPANAMCVAIVGPVPKNSGMWHYIDLEFNGTDHKWQAYCPDGNCLVSKVEQFENTLMNSTDDAARRTALVFLVHLFGDIHQPLHAIQRGCDRGGNLERVNFYFKREERANENLHHVWDEDLIDGFMAAHKLTDAASLARYLERHIHRADAEKWEQAGIEDIAWESFDLAKQKVYSGIPFQNFCGVNPPPPAQTVTDLTSSYEKTNENTVRDQLMRAGVRLAAVIERDLAR